METAGTVRMASIRAMMNRFRQATLNSVACAGPSNTACVIERRDLLQRVIESPVEVARASGRDVQARTTRSAARLMEIV